MFSITNYYPNIIINKTNGIYTFDTESATGKTYLATLINRYRANYNIRSFTYSDILLDKDTIITFLQNNIYDLVMFDRADLYPDFFKEYTQLITKHKLVLIDSKYNGVPIQHHLASIDFNKEKIEVE